MKEEPKIRENCGFCVTHTLEDAHAFINSLQHRGREAAGIAFIGDTIDVIKWLGKVERFDTEDLSKMFPKSNYHTYLAHVRYATRGRKDKILEDAHPHVIGGSYSNRGDHVLITDCDVAGVHNGQVNPEFLKLIDRSQLKTECDTEALLYLYQEITERGILKAIPGAYTLAIADKKRKDIIVLRDRAGIKPGVLGEIRGKTVVASEDIAIRKANGNVIDDLTPGCAYYLSPNGTYKEVSVISPALQFCHFEYNYVANVDSILNGIPVRRLRKTLGEILAEEFPIEADVISFLPRCPEPAAREYAKKMGKEISYIFYKPRGERAFQGSTMADRKKSISDNLYIMPRIQGINAEAFLRDKSIILIDDSTIRGNNSKRAVELLKSVGVKKIYLLNYTPKIGIVGEDGVPRGCLYGVDMPPDDSFIVRNRTDDEISKDIGAETHFLSKEGMLKVFESLGLKRENLCYFCIGGRRPF